MIFNLTQKLFHKIGFNIEKIQGASGKTEHSLDLKLYKTKTGNFYLPKKAHGDIVIKEIINDRIFDEAIVKIAESHIKSDSAVLDIGSNFGQMAILFSKMVGDNGMVYAFEADPFIFSVLEMNIKANDCKNIIAINKAVHKTSDELLFFPAHDFSKNDTYGSFGIDYKNKSGRPIKSIAIDALDIDLPISFMKIDIQGGDLFALQGAKKTIENNKMPIIFEYEINLEEEQNLCFQDYVELVNEIDYKFVKVIPESNFLIYKK